jgi:hypothetical protein
MISLGVYYRNIAFTGSADWILQNKFPDLILNQILSGVLGRFWHINSYYE